MSRLYPGAFILACLRITFEQVNSNITLFSDPSYSELEGILFPAPVFDLLKNSEPNGFSLFFIHPLFCISSFNVNYQLETSLDIPHNATISPNCDFDLNDDSFTGFEGNFYTILGRQGTVKVTDVDIGYYFVEINVPGFSQNEYSLSKTGNVAVLEHLYTQVSITELSYQRLQFVARSHEQCDFAKFILEDLDSKNCVNINQYGVKVNTEEVPT